MQHSQRQADHLQILATGRRGDVPGLGTDVEVDGLLQPGNQEVRALLANILLDTGQSVEDDGSCPALDVVDGLAGNEGAGSDRDGHAVRKVQGPCDVRHCEGVDGQVAGGLFRCGCRKSWKDDGVRDRRVVELQHAYTLL